MEAKIEIQFRGRTFRALLISMCLHLILIMILALTLYSKKAEEIPDELPIAFVDSKKLRPTRPEMRRSLKVKPLDVSERKIEKKEVTEKLDESSNRFDEVIKQAPLKITRSATVERHLEKTNYLPKVMTIADGIKGDGVTISKQVSTRDEPGEGEGMLSFRQRVKGNGKGGLGMAQSSGTAKVGLPSLAQDSDLDTDTDVDIELSPIADAMGKIAYNIINRNKSGFADVVFVVDTSGSMQDNIQDVAENLYTMTDTYDKAGLDYYLGVVQFNVVRDGERVQIDPLTHDPGLLRKRMKSMQITGEEYALDALVQALDNIEFRPASERNLILVTDEPARTGWRVKGAIQELRTKIIQKVKLLRVSVNVLGYNEPFQKELAERTMGLWQEIPGGQAGGSSTAAAGRKGAAPSVEVTHKMLRYFREFARHISRTSGGGITGEASVKGHAAKVDIVIMMDYSRSMAGKAEAIKTALDSLWGTLDLFSLDYQVGLIRFAEGKDKVSVIKSISVAQLPLENDGILRLLSFPYGGDEHLLDAIVEGLPKVRFKSKRRTVLIITDEPSTGKHSVDEALKVCQELNLQVNVLGPMPSGSTEKTLEKGTQLPCKNFLSSVVNQTGGIFRPMPGSLAFADASQ